MNSMKRSTMPEPRKCRAITAISRSFTPRFPEDLVARLAAGAVDIAVPVTLEDGRRRRQPAFCLMRTALRDDLAEFVGGGGRKIDDWLARHALADVPFDDSAAFFNANTLDELDRLERDA